MKKFLLILFLSASLVVNAQSDIYRAHFRPYRIGINALQFDSRMAFPLGFQLEGFYMKENGMLDARIKLNTSYVNFIDNESNFITSPTSYNLNPKNIDAGMFVFEANVGMNFFNRYKDPATIVRTHTFGGGRFPQRSYTVLLPGSKLYNIGMHAGFGRQQSNMFISNESFELIGADLYNIYDSATNSPHYNNIALTTMTTTYLFLGAHLHKCEKPEKLYHRIGYGAVKYTYIDVILPIVVNYRNVIDKNGNEYSPVIKNDNFNKFGYRLGVINNGTGYFGTRINLEVGKMPIPYDFFTSDASAFTNTIINYISFGIGLHITPTKKVIEFPYK